MKIFERIKDWWNDDSMEVEYISWEQHFIKKDEPAQNDNGVFHKIFSFELWPEKKQKIANNIIENSNVDKLYWIQLVVSCMLATLGLLSNSIPVIIGSMLVSPILTPIQSFAFAVVWGKRHLYVKSLKILILSIAIAIVSSFLICYLVPFASITEQVLLRWSPTVIDLVVALLSGVIAFIFLWSDKLEESIVWIAIAVSLMPPLASVWIWLHFMDYAVAQWTFLLFITNLVGILVVWILIFFLFWFKPTNKEWKKRTDITLLLVIIFIGLIMVPLWKSMIQISETQKITNIITTVSDDYFSSLDEWIKINEIKYRNMPNNIVRVVSKLDVPSDYVITNLHKDELTKMLSSTLWKSVELDLDIVEISSVYIWDENDFEKDIIDDVSAYLDKENILLVDYKILQDDVYYFFFDVYANSVVNENEIYSGVNSMISNKYNTAIKIILQWQDNPQLNAVKKTDAELKLEKQFYALLPKAQLTKLTLNYVQELQNEDEYAETAQLYLEFTSPYNISQTKNVLSEWKDVIKEYLWMDVSINTKISSFSLVEL